MAVLYITEYEDLARDSQGNAIAAGKEPAVATQAVTFTTSTQSAAFNGKTNFVFIVSDTLGYIRFGSSPTAVTTEPTRMPADVGMFFGVKGGDRVAAVT